MQYFKVCGVDLESGQAVQKQASEKPPFLLAA